MDKKDLLKYIKLLRFHYYDEMVDVYKDPTGHELWREIEDKLKIYGDDWYKGLEDEIREADEDKEIEYES